MSMWGYMELECHVRYGARTKELLLQPLALLAVEELPRVINLLVHVSFRIFHIPRRAYSFHGMLFGF